MPKNYEEVNVEDTVQTPKVSFSEGVKAIETVIQFFEQQGASVMNSPFLHRLCRFIIESSSGQSFIPTNLGRVDEEMIPQGMGYHKFIYKKVNNKGLEIKKKILSIKMGDVLAKIVNPDKSSSRPSFRTLLESERILRKGSFEILPDRFACPLHPRSIFSLKSSQSLNDVHPIPHHICPDHNITTTIAFHFHNVGGSLVLSLCDQISTHQQREHRLLPYLRTMYVMSEGLVCEVK
ncbi:hypothetical protein TNCV_2149471 [Trichonephila clavipes]|nr:hypothetical protein TNCV_2149471 [Trichonephila clavipes]